MTATRILFLCTRNACRSQMAEGFARARKRPGVEVYSAGTTATTLHPIAVQVMAESGIDISAQKSKTIADLDVEHFDIVITLCSTAAESCPLLPGNPVRLDWNLEDPEKAKGDESARRNAFRRVRDEIARLVADLYERGYLAALTRSHSHAELVLDNISDGILSHDTSRRITVFNKAAERITGRKASEILRKQCNEVFDGGLCGGKCNFAQGQTPQIDAPIRRTMDIRTQDGDTRTVDFVVNPLKDDQGQLQGVIATFRDLTHERDLERKLELTRSFSGIIGHDNKMLEVFDLIRDLAESNVPVLIHGESGTGKELVAAAIHNEGPRANRQFVPVNCGALPEALLESELFGHVKGAFTGAIRDKKGRFELADGGTIFLDEIGDISPAMQVKLLRVLQEGHFERVGGEKTIQVNVRVISATNKDLSREIAENRFREDLYYRLNVVPLYLPPLRERRNDIPILVDYLLKRFLKDAGREPVDVSPEAMDIMLSYDWPGNVRELQNWLQFALVKSRGKTIRPDHFPPVRTPIIPRETAPKQRQQLSTAAIREALRHTNGSKIEAAKFLRVSRATLYRFLDDHPLDS